MPDHNGRVLLDSKGREVRTDEPPDNMAVPHVFTFTSILSGSQRTYFHQWDEAMRRSREHALAMRREPFIMRKVDERIEATVKAKWHLKVDNEKDPWQKYAKDLLTKVLQRMPFFKRYRRQLGQGTWYGRFGVQHLCDWAEIEGQRVWQPKRFVPTNGDKIGHLWDGTPYLLIHPTEVEKYDDAHVINTTQGRALVLEGRYRESFTIHYHNPTDADFFESEMAEGIYGVGIRSIIYWLYDLRQEYLSWVVDAMERIGLGVVVIYYDAGNPEAKTQAEDTAKNFSRRSVLTVPRLQGAGAGGHSLGAVEVVEAPTAGAAVVLQLQQYVDQIIEQYIVGQTMSSGADNESGLGGTGRAEFAAGTKSDIVSADADDQAETLTGSEDQPNLLYVVKKYTCPWADFPVWFAYSLDEPAPEQKLGAISMAFNMGASFDADQVREITGMSKPDTDAEVLSAMQLQLQQLEVQQVAAAQQAQQQAAMGGMGAPGGGEDASVSTRPPPGGGGGGSAGPAGSPAQLGYDNSAFNAMHEPPRQDDDHRTEEEWRELVAQLQQTGMMPAQYRSGTPAMRYAWGPSGPSGEKMPKTSAGTVPAAKPPKVRKPPAAKPAKTRVKLPPPFQMHPPEELDLMTSQDLYRHAAEAQRQRHHNDTRGMAGLIPTVAGQPTWPAHSSWLERLTDSYLYPQGFHGDLLHGDLFRRFVHEQPPMDPHPESYSAEQARFFDAFADHLDRLERQQAAGHSLPDPLPPGQYRADTPVVRYGFGPSGEKPPEPPAPVNTPMQPPAKPKVTLPAFNSGPLLRETVQAMKPADRFRHAAEAGRQYLRHAGKPYSWENQQIAEYYHQLLDTYSHDPVPGTMPPRHRLAGGIDWPKHVADYLHRGNDRAGLSTAYDMLADHMDSIDSAKLWNEGTVPKIAAHMIYNRDYEHLPIFADALEDAGFGEPHTLQQLRSGKLRPEEAWQLLQPFLASSKDDTERHRQADTPLRYVLGQQKPGTVPQFGPERTGASEVPIFVPPVPSRRRKGPTSVMAPGSFAAEGEGLLYPSLAKTPQGSARPPQPPALAEQAHVPAMPQSAKATETPPIPTPPVAQPLHDQIHAHLSQRLMDPNIPWHSMSQREQKEITAQVAGLPADYAWSLLALATPTSENDPHQAKARELVAKGLMRRGAGQEQELTPENEPHAHKLDLSQVPPERRPEVEQLVSVLPKVKGAHSKDFYYIPEGVDLGAALGVPISARPMLPGERTAAIKRGLLPENIGSRLSDEELSDLRENSVNYLHDLYKLLPPDEHWIEMAHLGESQKDWYEHAARAFKGIFGKHSARFNALLGARSPQVRVKENMILALATWEAWTDAGRPTDPTAIKAMLEKMPARFQYQLGSHRNNIINAFTLPEEAMWLSPRLKTHNFTKNLMGDMNAVTNDVWMAHFAGVDQGKFLSKHPGYLAMVAKTREIADKLGWKPAQVQATIWSAAKMMGEAMRRGANPKEAVERARTSDDVENTAEFLDLIRNDADVQSFLNAAGFRVPRRLQSGGVPGATSKGSGEEPGVGRGAPGAGANPATEAGGAQGVPAHDTARAGAAPSRRGRRILEQSAERIGKAQEAASADEARRKAKKKAKEEGVQNPILPPEGQYPVETPLSPGSQFGRPSEAMIEALVDLGVPEEQARNYSSAAAGAIIGRMRKAQQAGKYSADLYGALRYQRDGRDIDAVMDSDGLFWTGDAGEDQFLNRNFGVQRWPLGEWRDKALDAAAKELQGERIT